MTATELTAKIADALRALQAAAQAQAAESLDTDLVKMSTACNELAQLLEHLSERATGADATALRSLRHDLRTPVGQLLGYCELLREEFEDEGDERWLPALSDIHDDVAQLRKAVDALGAGLGAPTASARALSAKNRGSGSENPPHTATILVIDDNAANRDLLDRLLRRDGRRVCQAEDGVHGLERARVGDIDLVLLDIVMPGLDGYGVLDELMGDDRLQHLPVIMLTSLDERDSITRCIEAGAWDHVPKPFDPVILRSRINSALERKLARDKERKYLTQIVAEKKRADELLHSVIPIGVALSGERNQAKLLSRILQEARRFCGAEAGALYLCVGGNLQLQQLQVEQLGISGAPDPDVAASLMNFDGARPHPAVAAARQQVAINIPDIRGDTAYDVTHLTAFDDQHRLRTTSVLSLPLLREGAALGVLELWNARRADDDALTGFSYDSVEILFSLSALASAALDASQRESDLRQQIRRLEIRIDAGKRARQVSEITETDYFKQLRIKARQLRKGPES